MALGEVRTQLLGPMIYEFGTCELDTARRQLRRYRAPVHLEPQAFDLLCFLIEHRDRAVSKDEIFETIWRGRAVSESVLTTRIRTLRRTIDDTAQDTSLIRTLHKIGYQFEGEVTLRDDGEATASGSVQEQIAIDPVAVRVSEMRQVLAVAVQPRIEAGRPFDQEAVDLQTDVMRGQLETMVASDYDVVMNAIDGTLFAVIGAEIARDGDAARAAAMAHGFRNWCQEHHLSAAVGLTAGTIYKQGVQIRGSALLRASQTVGAAFRGEVVVSNEAFARLPVGIRYRHEGNRILLEDTAPDPHRSGRDAPFVGRLVELGLLEGAVEATVSKNSGGVITIEGAAGMGKTRLVDRAIEMIREHGGRHSLVYTRELSAPGVVARNIFNGFGNLLDDVDALAVGQPSGVAGALRRLLRPSSDLAGIGGYTTDQGEAVKRLLQHVSRDGPVLVVIEDAHWIDPDSEKLALDLAAACSAMKVIMLVTARPAAHDLLEEIGLQAAADVVSLTLNPLSTTHSRELVRGMTANLCPHLVDQLVARSQGNPLFLTRLVEMAIEHGEAALLQVPETIQSVVQVQFDQLSPAQKDNLRDISVLGERIERSVANIAFGEEKVAASLTNGFLRAGAQWLQFSHNLVREAIYNSLPVSRREHLHTQVAGSLVGYDPLLATEHAMRGDLTVAPQICVRLARDTFNFRRHNRSVELMEQAVKLDCTREQSSLLHMFLGSAKAELGEYKTAMEHYQASATMSDSSTSAVFAFVRIARMHMRALRLDEAETAIEAGQKRLDDDPGPGFLSSELEETRSVLARLRRDLGAALRHGEEAVAVSDHPHSTARALAALAEAHLAAGNFLEAYEQAHASEDVVRKTKLGVVEPGCIGLFARCLWYAAPGAETFQALHHYVDRADEIGQRLPQLQTRLARLEAAAELGETQWVELDAEKVASILGPMDICDVTRLVFLQRFFAIETGELSHETGAVATEELFMPLCASADEQRLGPETPYEMLWRLRMSGDSAALRCLPNSDLAGSSAWIEFVTRDV